MRTTIHDECINVRKLTNKRVTKHTHLVTMLCESSVAPPSANVIQVGSPLNNALYSVKVKKEKQQSKFVWNNPISSERKRRVYVYNGLEALVFVSLIIAHVFLTQKAYFVVLAYSILAIDAIIFVLLNQKAFRVGLSSKAILVADREIILIYLNGLRKVSISQQTIYFDYIKDLQLSFPLDCIATSQKESFFNSLQAQIDRDKVLFQYTK